MTGVRLLIVASLVIVLAAWAAISPVAQSRGQPHIATIRTLPAGPASLSAAVWPAFAVDGRGTAYFFDGTCGAKPANCWCDVMRQRAGERHPTVIAGHVPGSDLSAATPAQRLTLAGCNSIAVESGGAVDLFAFDRALDRYGSKSIFRIDPVRGAYRERHTCLSCADSRTTGPLRTISFYGVQSAAFEAAGHVYLANDEHHVLQRLDPNGMVSVVMRPHCRSRYESGPLVEIHGCVECANWNLGQNGDVYTCPERPAIGPRGGIYYIDADDDTVRVVDQQGHEHVVAGEGTCRIAALHRCGTNVRATKLRLRDAAGNGPRGLALGTGGNLYITLWSYLLQVAPSGVVHVLAGNGQVLLSARHHVYPPHVPATQVPITAQAVAVDPHGHVYFLDDTGVVREVVP